MLAVLALLAAAPLPGSGGDPPAQAIVPAEPLAGQLDERDGHFAPPSRERSKKELWLLEKALRPDARTADADLRPVKPPPQPRPRRPLPPEREAEARLAEPFPAVGCRVEPITSLYNQWNREALPLLPGRPYRRPFQLFLRDRFTQEATQADPRLAIVLVSAALRFRSSRVEVVSGYRSPKLNLMLRKKGHQVARESQHLEGKAVDFRVRGASTEALGQFVRGLRVGGVGTYPRNKFIHADTGKVRHWGGS
jgi:hypothetical protein